MLLSIILRHSLRLFDFDWHYSHATTSFWWSYRNDYPRTGWPTTLTLNILLMTILGKIWQCESWYVGMLNLVLILRFLILVRIHRILILHCLIFFMFMARSWFWWCVSWSDYAANEWLLICYNWLCRVPRPFCLSIVVTCCGVGVVGVQNRVCL